MKAQWAVLAVLAVAMTGCGKSIHDYAEKASSELGMPVVVETTDSDACALKQMTKFYKDWSALSKNDQDIVRNTLRSKYSSIAVGTTTTVGATTIERVELNLARRFCSVGYGFGWGPGRPWGPGYPPGWYGWRSPYYASCGTAFIERKMIGNAVKDEGKNPETRLEKTSSRIAMKAEQKTLTQVERQFYTPFSRLYFSINSVNDGMLELAILRGDVWQGRPSRFQGQNCGKLATINDLIDAPSDFQSAPEMDADDLAPVNWTEVPVADGELVGILD